MKNKILALMMAVNAILLMMGMPQSQAALDTDSILHRMRAVELVRDHSTVLWDAEEAARVSKKDYDKQVLRSNTIDIQKMFVFHNPFTDEDVYHYFSLSEQMQMRMLKEFIPEQMKYVWEMKLKAVSATENALANTAEPFFRFICFIPEQAVGRKIPGIARKAYEREKPMTTGKSPN